MERRGFKIQKAKIEHITIKNLHYLDLYVITDCQTGVQYLTNPLKGGFSVLVDRNGNPLIDDFVFETE